LWIDLVIPQDGRGASATAWAADIKDLLRRAGVPHRAETVHVPGAPGAPDPAQLDALRARVLGAWGCMSLLESYLGTAGRMPGLHRRACARSGRYTHRPPSRPPGPRCTV